MQNTAEHRKNDGYNVIPIYEDRNSMVSYRGADDIRQRAEHTRERREERLARRIAGYVREELENCTAVVWNMPEEEPMAYERTRVLVGKTKDGKPIYRQVSGKTQDERNDEIVKAYIQSGRIWDFIDLSAIAGTDSLGGIGAASAAQDACSSITVAEYAEGWLNRYKRGKYSVSYEYQLERRVAQIRSYFDGRTMNSITTDDIQMFFNQLGHLSQATLSTIRGTLKELFTFAAEEKVIASDAIIWRRIHSSGTEKKTRRAATVEQYNDIISHIDQLKDPVEQLMIAILAYTGMRPEELRGLKWEDIDIDNARINIERAVTYTNKHCKAVIKEPKTRTSKTWLPISDGLMTVLERHRRESGWVIHNENGELFASGNSWQSKWGKLTRNIELYGLRACEFRKTFATVLTARGTDPKTVQRWLRHSKMDTTMNVYAEVDETIFVTSCDTLKKIA